MTIIESKDTRARRRTELDMAAVLAPLSGPDASGPDLYDDPAGPFAAIDEARRMDDGLAQGIWVTDRKAPDWDSVVALCQDALATRTKDLRLAVRLVEALVCRDGFSGLAPGFDMLSELCRSFWPGLHPAIDEDGDMTGRGNAVAILNSKLPQVVRTLPATRSGFGQPVSFSWADYETALLYESKGSAQADGFSVAEFQASAGATPTEFFQRMAYDLAAGLTAVERFDQHLDELFRRQAPSLAAIKELLGQLLGWLGTMLPLEPDGMAEETDLWAEAGDLPGESRPTFPASRIDSRPEAYRRLAEVADYLMRVEPHSPAPHMLRRILAWEHMPFDELLIDMAGGRNDLSAVLDLLASAARS